LFCYDDQYSNRGVKKIADRKMRPLSGFTGAALAEADGPAARHQPNGAKKLRLTDLA
jgi:hypothetical protein